MNILRRSLGLFFLGLYIDIFQRVFDGAVGRKLAVGGGLTGRGINKMSILMYRNRWKFIKMRQELDELLKNAGKYSII